MKGTAFVAAACLAACAGTRVHAQIPSVMQAPPEVVRQSAPVVPPRVAPEAQPAGIDPRDVRMMEIVLTNAVRTGAQNLSAQMQAREPGSLFVVDTARARGFVLEGYGVFFAVDVPMMRQAAVWSARQLQQQDMRNQIDRLNTIAANPVNDVETRKQAAFQARMLGIQLQGTQGGTTVSMPSGALASSGATPVADSTTPPPGGVRAANVDEKVAPLPAPPPPAPVAALSNPNDLYTEAVKTALIDAMLKHSFSLHLGDNEYLTVAASDGEGPTVPGQIYDASTILIRIKGSDLSAFVTNKITREEVYKRVQIREF